MRLLVVEDEFPMRNALMEALQGEGYRVVAAEDGPSGLEKALSDHFDLILLDVMMPGLDGYTVCQTLRHHGRTVPVLMLTAKAQVDDRVNGLDAGADDYLVKPFSMKELLARVRALLRRRLQEDVPEEVRIGTTTVDLKRQQAASESGSVSLSAKEFQMLRLLAAAAGEPVSRERFLDEVWGYNTWPTTRTVDNFVANLRAKLEPNPSAPRFLLTVRGVGYRLQI